ncbi:MAG: MFS transporter [Actinomycetota bacterium]|nr:MFS transporter [Actinomycetota bacterium]
MANRKLFTLFFIQLFLLGIGGSVVGPLIPILSGSFDIGLDIIGTTLSLNAFGLLVASLFSGILSERFGKKNILSIGSILFTASFLSLYFSGNYVLFTISYLLFGISWGTIVVNSNSIISDCFDSNRSSIIIRLNIGFLLGAAFAPLIVSGVLFFDISWRLIFISIALVNLILFMLIMLFKHDNLGNKKSTENFIILLSTNRGLFTSIIIIFCGIISFLHFGMGFSFGAWFTNYFESLNVPVSISSIILSLNLFVFCAGMLLQSSLVNKFSEKKLMQFFSGCAFIFLFASFLVDHLIIKILFITFFNFSFSGIATIALSLAIKQKPRHSGSITSIINSYGFTGTIIFQYIAGYLSENISASSIFYTSLSALLLLVLFTSILRIYPGRTTK